MALVTSSVVVVSGPHPDAEALDRQVAELRLRFPRAIIDRYRDRVPCVAEGAFIAPGASVVADVRLGAGVSVWYGAVLRGDIAPVIIGDRSNVQDGTVIHVADDGPCVVGADVVIGHRAMLHACRIEDACLIGMQATVLDDAVIGCGSIVGAGAVVTPRTIIPPYSLVLGMPGKVVRTLDEKAADEHRALAGKYTRITENYLRDSLRRG
jgi:carbonic anhydrase/acetyltransferase-like protein (isoleucine patch superfamily)